MRIRYQQGIAACIAWGALALRLWGQPSLQAESLGTVGAEAPRVVQASAVRISNSQGRFLGCGVVIAQRAQEFDVLTAAHIVSAEPRLVVQCFAPGKDGAVGPLVKHGNLKVRIQDPRADLAVLEVRSGIPPAGVVGRHVGDAMATQKLGEPGQIHSEQNEQKLNELGEGAATESPAAVIAAPFVAWAVEWTQVEALQMRKVQVVRRQVARRTLGTQPVSFWVLAEPSRSGMSGGGLFSESGELVGVASGNSGQHAYYTDDLEMGEFLKKL